MTEWIVYYSIDYIKYWRYLVYIMKETYCIYPDKYTRVQSISHSYRIVLVHLVILSYFYQNKIPPSRIVEVHLVILSYFWHLWYINIFTQFLSDNRCQMSITNAVSLSCNVYVLVIYMGQSIILTGFIL